MSDKKKVSDKSRYADHIKEWEEITASAAANASELPQLELLRVALEKLLQEARDLTKQQAALQAGKQESSKRLQAVMREGKKVATVMRGGLKQHYGNRAEKLVEFGLQPFRGRKAKPAETPDVPPPQSVESPQPASDTDEQ
jgi:hypothetical protein